MPATCVWAPARPPWFLLCLATWFLPHLKLWFHLASEAHGDCQELGYLGDSGGSEAELGCLGWRKG